MSRGLSPCLWGSTRLPQDSSLSSLPFISGFIWHVSSSLLTLPLLISLFISGSPHYRHKTSPCPLPISSSLPPSCLDVYCSIPYLISPFTYFSFPSFVPFPSSSLTLSTASVSPTGVLCPIPSFCFIHLPFHLHLSIHSSSSSSSTLTSQGWGSQHTTPMSDLWLKMSSLSQNHSFTHWLTSPFYPFIHIITIKLLRQSFFHYSHH